jgi:hypothetical protein
VGPASATNPISITLEARPVLSYAMAHNEIPVISRLAIDHVPTDLPGARLLLEVADATGPIGAPHEILLDLPAGPPVLTDLQFLLDPAAMLQQAGSASSTPFARPGRRGSPTRHPP